MCISSEPVAAPGRPAEGVVAAGVQHYHVQFVAGVVQFVQHGLHRDGAAAQIVFAGYIGVHGNKVILPV